jgi:hypothetical protein
MLYRTPEELPDEYRLYTPRNHKAYRPITDSVFQLQLSSAEFPNEDFDKTEFIDPNR